MLSRSLGVLAGQAGLAVLVVDMDTQENSTTWRKRRPEDRQLPIVEFTTEKGLKEVIARARAAECDVVFIDTPPGRSTEAAAAVEECDLTLVPCNGEIESFEGLPRTARLARTEGKRAIVVPNWVAPGSLTEEKTIRGVAEKKACPARRSLCTAIPSTKKRACLGYRPASLNPTARQPPNCTRSGCGCVQNCN